MRLMEGLATTEALAQVFSDQSVLEAMLEFEVAMARVEARLKIIPASAAQAIAKAAQQEKFNPAALAREAQAAGTPAIPFVKALRALVHKQSPGAADFVHWGATSQDVCDTALVLLIRKAHSLIASDLERLQKASRGLATSHRDTVMLGRTLLQPATPITFGLKVAGWFAAIERGRARLESAVRDSCVLQFGGAGGTLAMLGERGVEAGKALAQELDVSYPEAPWHSHRDRLAELLCSCGILAGSLGKIARDITLLAQAEVGELSEAPGFGRGGSSTMPHKQNPAGCIVTLAAVAQLPGLISSFLSGMAQEHERAAGAWQAEWSIFSRVIQATGLAAASIGEVMEKLRVNSTRMRENLQATRGAIFAERAMALLVPKLGRGTAEKLVAQALRRSSEENRNFKEALAEMDEVKTHLDAKTLRDLESPEQYLGAARQFQDCLLSESKFLQRAPQRGKE